MPSPIYRSLYWRTAIGFICCIAGVLAAQGAVLLWLLNRTDTTRSANLTQNASAELSHVLDQNPEADVARYLTEHYPRPPQAFYAVLKTGQVVSVGTKPPPSRAVQAALEEFRKHDVIALPKSWQGDPYHSSAIVADGHIVGAVAVVPQTWREQIGVPMFLTGATLLIAGTVLSSVFVFGPAHRRLRELENAALRLGAGDMAIRARDDGGDEVAALARAFNQMAGHLAAADRMRRLLLADVSHELLTPLTAVRGYQEKLAADSGIRGSEECSRCVSIIGDETQRLEHIVGDLLDLAKLESGGETLDFQDVSVEGLYGRVAARHAPQAARKQLKVSTAIESGAEIVFGDRFRLEQALQNLAANAIRHAPEQGHVELRADLQGTSTVLSVSDDGRGIPPEHVPFVFDRFYKADPARSGASSGSGLGLSIVKAIVERHGGTVSVSSEPHVRTTFMIRLPPAVSSLAVASGTMARAR